MPIIRSLLTIENETWRDGDVLITRKPPCLSAVAAAMIYIKRIPVTTPSQPLRAGPSGPGIPGEGLW